MARSFYRWDVCSESKVDAVDFGLLRSRVGAIFDGRERRTIIEGYKVSVRRTS